MGQEQTESLGEATRKIRGKSSRGFAWYLGAIISWILNKASDVVGWVSQNLWALVVGIGGLL